MTFRMSLLSHMSVSLSKPSASAEWGLCLVPKSSLYLFLTQNSTLAIYCFLMGDSQIILHNSTFYLLMTPWAVSIQLMWALAASKVIVGPHTHLCLCSASKLAEASWRLLSFDSWMSWMCPKVPCVNTLFPLGWPSLDVIEPAAHLGTRGGRGSVETGGSGIHWQP